MRHFTTNLLELLYHGESMGVIHSFKTEPKAAKKFFTMSEPGLKNTGIFYSSWLYNASLCANQTGNRRESLAIATEGIQHAARLRDADFLDCFIYRKGIAELELGDPNYIDTLFDLTRLSRFGLHSVRTDSMLQTLKNKCDIEMPSLIVSNSSSGSDTE